jgi:predicted homoserine dehydrogenase-like protein
MLRSPPRSFFQHYKATSATPIRSLATASTLDDHGVRTLGVVGAGQMGMGIAQTAAQVAKVNVLLMDNNLEAMKKSFDNMGADLGVHLV